MASFNGWATSLLRAVGAPVTKENLRALGAWQAAEGGSASFNPLNTTQPAKGASNYNGVGVKNFVNPQQGVQATAKTLLNGHYGNIVSLFRSGKATAKEIGTAVAQSPWGTGGGVLRVLGSGPVKLPAMAGASGRESKAVATMFGAPDASKQAMVAMMLDASTASAHGQGLPMSSLLEMAQMRKQSQASADIGPMPTSAPQQGGKAGFLSTAGLKTSGASLDGTDPTFARKVFAAAKAAGATQIRLTSAHRDAAHNASVGGVGRSNHIFGHAFDGEAFIPGYGWLPLGDLPTLGKFGLRSGDQPGFYNGGRDPVHVDDAYNQRL